MNIKKLIKDNYEIAKSKGFYPDDSKIEDHLMGIVSELGEAYEAHRGGKFYTNIINHKPALEKMLNGDLREKIFIKFYKECISGTFEDEIADVFIRLFNYSAFTGRKIREDSIRIGYLDSEEFKEGGFSKFFCLISRFVLSQQISTAYWLLFHYCKHHNIPIEKHIQAKMEYNKTREHLHGKQY